MDLKMEEVASLLHVSETTLMRWVQEHQLPCYQLQGQYLFSRSEVESWIFDQKTRKDAGVFHQDEVELGAWQTYSLYRAIHRGGVVFIESTTKEGAIDEVISSVATDLGIDRVAMIELLLDREKLMTTAVGAEVALPHTRECLIRGPHDVVIVAIPRQPIDWNALDNQGVKALFFLFACDDKRHLNLLAKIAHLSSNKELMNKIKQGVDKGTLLSWIKEWEHSLAQKTQTHV